MQPFTLYDPNTDECPVPQELLKNIDQLSDDDLLELLDRASTLQAELAQAVGALKADITMRMKFREATVIDTPQFTVKLERNVTYDYDIPRLLGIRHYITGEQFDKAVKTVYKPNKTELNKLVKLGGQVKAIIDASVTPVEGSPSLKVERKIQPVEKTTSPSDDFF